MKKILALLVLAVNLGACSDNARLAIPQKKSEQTSKKSSASASSTTQASTPAPRLVDQLETLMDERVELEAVSDNSNQTAINSNIDRMTQVLDQILGEASFQNKIGKNSSSEIREEDLEALEGILLAFWQIPAGEEATIGTMKELAYSATILALVSETFDKPYMSDRLSYSSLSRSAFSILAVIEDAEYGSTNESRQKAFLQALHAWSKTAIRQEDLDKSYEASLELVNKLEEYRKMYEFPANPDDATDPCDDPAVRALHAVLLENYQSILNVPQKERILQMTFDALMIWSDEAVFKVNEEIVPLIPKLGADAQPLISLLENQRNFFGQRIDVLDNPTLTPKKIALSTEKSMERLDLNYRIERINTAIQQIESQKP